MLRKTVKLILILICMLTIFSLSAENSTKSSKKSDGLIIRISEKLVKHQLTEKEKNHYVDKYVVFVRKSAHLSIYLILGFLIISFIKEFKITDTKALVIAIFITFLYACSDELHQLFVPGRSGEILDVMIDTIGSFLGIIIYLIYKNLRRKKYE